MQILVNNELTDARVLLYEGQDGLIEVTRNHLLTINKDGYRDLQKDLERVDIEENGRIVAVKVDNKKQAQLSDAKKWKYDFSKSS